MVLEMSVRGKTGRRNIICRSGTVNYLKRIQGWCPDVVDMRFKDLVKAKIDLPVFRLPDGTASQNLRQTFKRLMIDTGLLPCPRTGQNRTLYSFRHTYATFALLNDGMDIHTLAIQMGEPPHLNWSTVIFKKRRTKNDKRCCQTDANSSLPGQ